MAIHSRVVLPILSLLCGAYTYVWPGPQVQAEAQVRGQETQSVQERFEAFQRKSVSELISDLRQKPRALGVVLRLRELGDRSAIAPLREALSKVEQPTEKSAIAAALVSLGDSDESSWNLLAQSGNAAAETDMPYPLQIDEAGNPVKGKPSPEFTQWYNENKARFEGRMNPIFEIPTHLRYLGLSGDRRAVPILLKALKNRNYSISAAAAWALSRLQDKTVIPAIIEACEQAPAGVAEGIAIALLHFEDTQAQEAAERFFVNKQSLEALRKGIADRRAKGMIR